MQHYFAALDGKRFLLGGFAEDLTVLTDVHIPILARMLNVLQLLVLDLCELLQILCLVYSFCIALQPHTTSQSEYRLLQLYIGSGPQTFSSHYPNRGSDYMPYYPQYFAVIA